jgi:hypothetical protein
MVVVYCFTATSMLSLHWCLLLIMKLWDTYLASGWLFCFMVLDGCCFALLVCLIGVLSFHWCVITFLMCYRFICIITSYWYNHSSASYLHTTTSTLHVIKLILGGTGFRLWQLLGYRYLEYMALKLVCLCYHSISVLLRSPSVWHCLKLSIVGWTMIRDKIEIR